MTSHSVPILISKWDQKLFSATVLDGPKSEACAETSAGAFQQVKDHLKKLARKGDDHYWPKIERFELKQRMVTVRLYYREHNRQFPASRELRMSIRYVLGHYVDESLECFLPDFDVVFYSPSARELDRLIEEQVRSCAAQLDSQQLTAVALPLSSEIRMVRVTPQSSRAAPMAKVPNALTDVAVPMVARSRKQKYVRADGRESVVREIEIGLLHGNVLVVGQAGSGKTTLLRTAAHLLQDHARDRATSLGEPSPIAQVWQTSAEDVIAGMAYLGQWESRVEDLLAAADDLSVILAFRSMIDLVRLGGSGPADSVASFLDGYLGRGEMRMAAECTEDELLAVQRLMPGFVNHFRIVRCPNLTTEDVATISRKMLRAAERNHSITVESSAATLIATLMARLLPYEAPPRGVVELTQELIDKREPVGIDQVIHAVNRRTGLPEMILRDDQLLSVQSVKQHLAASVVGQPKAIDVAAGVVMRVKAGLCDPERPISTMLFTGPTGVGKTQLSTSLADYLFGACDASRTLAGGPLIRLDMSEYGSYDGASRFMMGDDGNVADWIGRLRRRPMSVVLLDEFEKASPEVHDLLLSALDEGRLTDRFGRTTSLCGAIIILTSNVGATQKPSVGIVGDDPTAVELKFEKAVRESFRPEFINRLDDVVSFSPLDKQTTREIALKELAALSRREALVARSVKLTWSDRCVDWLADKGFDPKLGARPLQRVIEQHLVAKIAREILGNSEKGPMAIDLDQHLPDPAFTETGT